MAMNRLISCRSISSPVRSVACTSWRLTVVPSSSDRHHHHHRRRRRRSSDSIASTRRPFSSSSSRSDDGSSNRTNNTTLPPSCDVIQGPSLLRTPVSRPEPSLLFLPGLRSLPYWTTDDDDGDDDDGSSSGARMQQQQKHLRPTKRIAYNDPTVTHVVQHLESHAHAIRDEYLKVSPQQSDYQTNGHGDSALHHGRWDWQSYMSKGSVQGRFAQTYPHTASVLQELRTQHLLFEGTPFGFAFFSTLHPLSRIDAHAGPMNLRLRIHLPLIVPHDGGSCADEGAVDDAQDRGLGRIRPLCGIQVGTHHPPRRWVANSAMVLDDSYVHRVWNESQNEKRVLLLVDMWHPDIAHGEKEAIVGMFQQAKREGLWKR